MLTIRSALLLLFREPKTQGLPGVYAYPEEAIRNTHVGYVMIRLPKMAMEHKV